jgi:hypothetical protein
VKATLEAINQMQADGVVGEYAIGGAVGPTLYLEPAATLDVHIFVTLPSAPGSSLLSLVSLYGYLKALGGTVQDEPIVVGGWPLQFLPPSNDLEHLGYVGCPSGHCAVHRAVKRYIRVLQFIEQNAVDRA